MKKILILVPAAFVLFCGFKLATNWYPISEKAEVKFILPNADGHNGAFSGLKANISFDPSKPETASIQASIETNTIQTGNEQRDIHLKNADFLDVEKYPLIRFQSLSVVKKDSFFVATGTLTMKETTKNIELPFQFKDQVFRGEINLRASDYGVMKPSQTAKDSVHITLDIPVKGNS